MANGPIGMYPNSATNIDTDITHDNITWDNKSYQAYNVNPQYKEQIENQSIDDGTSLEADDIDSEDGKMMTLFNLLSDIGLSTSGGPRGGFSPGSTVGALGEGMQLGMDINKFKAAQTT